MSRTGRQRVSPGTPPPRRRSAPAHRRLHRRRVVGRVLAGKAVAGLPVPQALLRPSRRLGVPVPPVLRDRRIDVRSVLGDTTENSRLPLVHPRQAEKKKARVIRGCAALLNRITFGTVKLWEVHNILKVEFISSAVDNGRYPFLP